MKIGVTAASGQLGSSIIQELIKEIRKENIIAIARTPENVNHQGVEVRKGDYNNPEEVKTAFEGVNKVLLVSGMDEPQKRIQQHRNVIEAAKLNEAKKIVYTSIIGEEDKTAFSPVVKSNRQTEKDIQESGLHWVIGRNGIYIEPDLEYLDHYTEEGEIRNCAGDGKCAYTSRKELGSAYAQLLLDERKNEQVFNLVGEPITQSELAEYINQVYQTDLKYNPISVEDFARERKEELGEFMGAIIAGIYEGIQMGIYDVSSDFKKAAGIRHKSALEMIRDFKNEQD